MKILLTGASGLLGRAVFDEFKYNNPNVSITGTAFSRTGTKFKKLDLTDKKAVNAFISEYNPDLIIHSAAERRPDVVQKNPEKAQKINVEATETLALAAENCGSAIIYMSTNYVFDGKNPPFYPESKTNPLNSYGRMKLAGEQKISEICSKSIILRIPILYGQVEYIGESTVTTIVEGIFPDKESFFDNKQPRYPTHSADIASAITALADKIEKGESIQGIYHCSSEKPYTKFQMAQIMAETLRIDPNLIKEAAPDPDAAPRPENAKLDTGRLKELGLNNHRAFEPAIRDILKKLLGL